MRSILNTNNHIVSRNISYLVLASIMLNAFLSFTNAHLFTLNKFVVIASEVCIYNILAFYFVLMNRANYLARDVYKLFCFFLLVAFFSMLLTSFAKDSGVFFVDGLRNFLIVILFSFSGFLVSRNDFHKVFFIVSLCVFIFLLIEIVSLDLYAYIFEPANYYSATRGHDVREYNSTGLFNAALSFEGRFSYGFFDGPRTSSIFLEQVSLGNYSQIVFIYLLLFSKNIGSRFCFFYIALIFLSVTSTESRSAGGLIFVYSLIFLFTKNLPKYFNFLLVPFVVLLGVFYVSSFNVIYSDNISGRFFKGMVYLVEFDFFDYFGFGVNKVNDFWDSGYPYLISSVTIFGALFLYLFTCLFHDQNYILSKRMAWFATFYLFLNIIVSGNSVYSIKTAPLLWFMFGFVKNKEQKIKKDYV